MPPNADPSTKDGEGESTKMTTDNKYKLPETKEDGENSTTHKHTQEHDEDIEMDMFASAPKINALPSVNYYQQKKTLAQGMMDIALISANCNQLRYILDRGRSHPYFFISLGFIILSLLLQVGVGIALVINSKCRIKDDKGMCKANKVNDWTIVLVFLVTIINIFLSAFGIVIEEKG